MNKLFQCIKCINVYYYVKCIMYLCYKIFNMMYGNNVYKGISPVNNNNNDNNFNLNIQ